MSTKKSSGAATDKAVWIIGVIIGGIIAVAAIVAITSSPDSSTTSGTTSEFSDVTVAGDMLPEYDSNSADVAIGMTAPVLTGKGFFGNIVTTTPGAPILLVFLAHWCQFCQREVPVLVEWEKSGKVPAGVDVIAISTAADPARPNYPPSMWLADENFPALWPVMTDSKDRTAGIAFGLSAYPFFVLLDANGKVAIRASGEIPASELTALLQTVVTS